MPIAKFYNKKLKKKKNNDYTCIINKPKYYYGSLLVSFSIEMNGKFCRQKHLLSNYWVLAIVKYILNAIEVWSTYSDVC